MTTPIQLNAGCGKHRVDGWVGVDLDPDADTDLISDLEHLPFPDRSINRIFCSHVMEHLSYWDKLPKVLHELSRVLADDGELCLVGPDIERAVLLGEPRQLLETIISWPDEWAHGWAHKQPPVAHAWTPTAPFMERALTTARFQVQSLTGHLRDAQKLGWPLADAGDWQHGFLCRKDFSS